MAERSIQRSPKHLSQARAGVLHCLNRLLPGGGIRARGEGDFVDSLFEG